MSNLSQRLQDGLIGEAPPIAHDWLRDTGHLKAAIATIEADLKGRLTTEKNLGALYNPSITDLERNEYHGEDRAVVYVEDVDKMITAAIEHYTRDKA